ncbi:MAG: hypothetical protein MUP85_15085 [Candidatus Lokiarchaeota archaeon]|nr:hypothetical protein [Candidatus Lokiarchaeota archaeon]
MARKGGRKVIHFYNSSGKLDNVVQFLQEIKKKINYLPLNCSIEGRSVKITIFGPRDLQYLATERLRELATQYLSS